MTPLPVRPAALLLSSSRTALTLAIPQLSAPASGATHRCDLRGAYFSLHIPEFQPEPRVVGLHFSHANRRCRKIGDGHEGYVLAVAKEGFTAGQPQFTVHVVNNANLMIGVAVANAPRTGAPYWHGLFLQHCNGHILSQNNFSQLLTTANCFPAGSNVTMRLDFEKGTASYEVDGRSLGLASCRLPPGPLYPAVVFNPDGADVEFVQ